MKILTHPDNIEYLKANAHEVKSYGLSNSILGFEVVAAEYLEPDESTGKYILPDGSIVEREDVRYKAPFIEYGPEDLEHLLYLGIVREERRRVFRVIDDLVFSMRYDTPILSSSPMVRFTSA